MKIAYYPGCTLKTSAQNFETSAIAASKVLGIEFEEIPTWNCCGTVYSLSSDDLLHQLAPIRNLIHVQDMGHKQVVSLCSMCYNTLHSANELVRNDTEKLETINAFLSQGVTGNENEYKTEVDVVHLLPILQQKEFWEKIPKLVKKSLGDMKVATYYGCTLTRPSEASIDENIEDPQILEYLLEMVGGKPIETIYKTECCGAYNTVNEPGIVVDRTYTIIKAAQKAGAEALILSCPLCDFNLDDRQKETAEKYTDFEKMPIFYFTQLLALALGVDEKECGFDQHYVDPYPLLKKYNLIK